MNGKAYAAGTVLNALATGIGSAFGIDLLTRVKLELDDKVSRSAIVDGESIEESPIVDRILSTFGLKGYVFVESEIPKGSGLGSSSAFVNALLVAVMKAVKDELDAHRILSANARISLELGISYTGAFDDASASLLGGFVVSNNTRLRLYRWDKIKTYSAVLIPRFKRMEIDWGKIRGRKERLSSAVELAKRGSYCEAMKENTKYYCEIIGYPLEVARVGWEKGVCCGLSGNGPCYVAFGEKKEMMEIKDVWSEYGKVVVRRVPDEPAEKVEIPKTLFI